MKTLFNYNAEEFIFDFLMPLKGETLRVEATASFEEVLTDEAIFRTALPEYIDVYMAKLANEKTGKLIESNTYQNAELLKVVSDTLTERLINNSFANESRVFLDQWHEASYELAHKY